ncbi:hypothetical protein PVIIG_03067 [Plasmodium vivax India VII]|uniref:carnosine N-methyltransferase n=1 Tax=Plasmodium vivax India VII TaxID=1077284 RepID=A0A0J9SCN6_PLAVI|nr:hypothetical protein PVIIG_03067 [Plasmodium vivax India VII]
MASGPNDESEAKPPAGECGQPGGSEMGGNTKVGLPVGGSTPSGKDCSGEDHPQDNADILSDEEERHFCNVCFSFLYYKKYCFYELLRIYRNVSSLTDEEKALLTESIYSKLYKMYLAVLNNYFFILNILLPQISTHIILHLLAHTVHRGDVVVVEDSASGGNGESEESDGSDGSDGSGGSGAEEASRSSSADGEGDKSAQGKPKKKRSRRIPREEYTINEILKNLTEEEKEKIDREYNCHNLDARLLCKDNPIVILKEIRSKLMNAKEDEGMSRELELNLERSTSADYLDVGYPSGRRARHLDEAGANLLGSSSLFPREEGDKPRVGGQQEGGRSPEKSHEVCREGERRKGLPGEHVPPGRRITSAYSPTLDEYNLLQNMSKVRSTLRQFVRDWSLEGKHERDSAYEPMLRSLEKYLPITDAYVPKVLCPGSGLGRLPYEVAKKGYRSQGNEFSYFMLLASNFILNYYNEKESLKIQPYCLNTLNRRKRDDHLKVVTLPDINTYNKAILTTDFSMCAGELIEVYERERGSFDGVLTCFFMDTAKNIFLYIRTFASILKPNSLWCNVGPLLYHYSEMTNELSIELSWEEIKVIISKWFTFVEVEWVDSYYTTNVDSMMQVQYHCIFFCAIRNDVPVDDPPAGGANHGEDGQHGERGQP